MPVNRTISLRVDASTWPTNRTPGAKLQALDLTLPNIDVEAVLLMTAACTAPPIAYGFELNNTWACLRYLPALDAGPGLILRPEWNDLDPHQKTILSDDFGMGLSCSVLWDALELVQLTPTGYFVKAMTTQYPNAVTLGTRTKKRGPQKSPDFIGRDCLGRLHVIECKGTQWARHLDEAIDDGRAQKANVFIKAPAVAGESLVGGVFVPQSGARSPALCKFIDPKPIATATVIQCSPDQSLWVGARAELARALRLMDFQEAATIAAEGDLTKKGPDALLRQRAELPRRKGKHGAYVVREFEYEFPQPLTKLKEGLTIRGVRVAFGLAETVFSTLLDQSVSAAVDVIIARTPQHARRVHDDHDLHVEETPGGTWLEIDLVRQ